MKGYKINPIIINGEKRWPVVENEDACITDPHQFFYTEKQFRYVERRALELYERVSEFENREGAVCPEDVSFEEEIERLKESLEMVKEDRDNYKAFWLDYEKENNILKKQLKVKTEQIEKAEKDSFYLKQAHKNLLKMYWNVKKRIKDYSGVLDDINKTLSTWKPAMGMNGRMSAGTLVRLLKDDYDTITDGSR